MTNRQAGTASSRAIAAHFYLVSIHPFGDGNGRTARAIESFLLYQAGVNAFGFYSLANFYYRERDRYVRELTDARFHHGGELTPFVLFGLEVSSLSLNLSTAKCSIRSKSRPTATMREKCLKSTHGSRERRARMLELVHGLAQRRLPGVTAACLVRMCRSAVSACRRAHAHA